MQAVPGAEHVVPGRAQRRRAVQDQEVPHRQLLPSQQRQPVQRRGAGEPVQGLAQVNVAAGPG